MVSAEYRYGKELAQYANFFRTISQEIDICPDGITQHFDHPAIDILISDKNMTPLQRMQLYEALAYGDVGVLFACPRTCLSGIMLRTVGTLAQQTFYFDYIKTNKVRSFFASTEPKHGSDAANIEMHIEYDENEPGKCYLTGEKILVGNAACATLGVVIARNAIGPLGLRPILITPADFANAPSNSYQQAPLAMFGIKPAQLGYLAFNKFPVTKENLLGEHLNPLQRGILAVVHTFNVMRLGICGLAIGHAQGILDYLVEHATRLTGHAIYQFKQLTAMIESSRLLAYNAANSLLPGELNGAKISLAKLTATEACEKVASAAFGFFDNASFIEHPFLLKRYRDAFGFEYMDGTTNIQRKNIYQGFIKNVL